MPKESNLKIKLGFIFKLFIAVVVRNLDVDLGGIYIFYNG